MRFRWRFLSNPLSIIFSSWLSAAANAVGVAAPPLQYPSSFLECCSLADLWPACHVEMAVLVSVPLLAVALRGVFFVNVLASVH